MEARHGVNSDALVSSRKLHGQDCSSTLIEECEEAFPLNDEDLYRTYRWFQTHDLSVFTHDYENGWDLSKEQLHEGKELLCEWHAIRCRRCDWPFSINILGRPHLLRFKMRLAV